MRNISFLLLTLLVFTSSCITRNADEKALQSFCNAFSSVNVKVRGEYALFVDENLSGLNYETYIGKVDAEEKASGKDVAEIVKSAEKRYFEPRPNTFVIVIYSKQMNAVICDDANTAFIDSVRVLKKHEPVPDLKSFVKGMKAVSTIAGSNERKNVIE